LRFGSGPARNIASLQSIRWQSVTNKRQDDLMLPLEGVRVAEFCEVAAGPFCGMLLADMGADVIKVERPEGDGMRQWPPFSGGFSENFASVNRNKRSVVFDLKQESDRASARALALSSDIVIENYRPGIMARYSLDYASLAAAKPGIVMVSMSAFGQDGPRAQEGGFDLTLQAIAGVMSVTGEPDGAPVKCGVPLCDFVTGLYGAYSAVCALRKVQNGEGGGHIDVPMMAATLAVAALQTSEFFGNGSNPKKLGSAHPRNAPYQAFPAAEGWFAMAAGNNRLWHRVCETIAMPDLEHDARFASPQLRAKNQEALRGLLDPIFKTRPATQWIELFSQAGVPCAPINGYSEALKDPQVEHLGLVQPLALPSGTSTRTVGVPMRLNGETFPIRRSPPAIGEHTEEVLAELGLGAAASSSPPKRAGTQR
jgi:crotonobetainyl-CoA:carnitine CoA-transferase CaiB-like acyl-CoA transferase